jgi:hypothetical protein
MPKIEVKSTPQLEEDYKATAVLIETLPKSRRRGGLNLRCRMDQRSHEPHLPRDWLPGASAPCPVHVPAALVPAPEVVSESDLDHLSGWAGSRSDALTRLL